MGISQLFIIQFKASFVQDETYWKCKLYQNNWRLPATFVFCTGCFYLVAFVCSLFLFHLSVM